jgi:hypothetical protein
MPNNLSKKFSLSKDNLLNNLSELIILRLKNIAFLMNNLYFLKQNS